MKRYDIKTTDTETLRKWYYLMSLGRALDEKAPSYLLQSLGWSYHAPYAGHDGIQLAIGQVFHQGEDYLFPYYRDMLTVLSAGMTAEEIILIEKMPRHVSIKSSAGLDGLGRADIYHRRAPFFRQIGEGKRSAVITGDCFRGPGITSRSAKHE